jgi:hypothetical protein
MNATINPQTAVGVLLQRYPIHSLSKN